MQWAKRRHNGGRMAVEMPPDTSSIYFLTQHSSVITHCTAGTQLLFMLPSCILLPANILNECSPFSMLSRTSTSDRQRFMECPAV